MTTRLIALAALALLLGGCATGPQHVVFVTKTSFAVDVSAQPAAASIGYDRVEGYIGPRFDNGNVPPVAASFVTNGSLFGRQIRQVYATGKAADIVTHGPDAALAPPGDGALPGDPEKTKPMFFATGTTVGLKVGFGTGGVTDWLTLGYKRREASAIPITGSEFPSVLATIESDQDTPAADKAKFGVGQYFATGTAAQRVAADPEVRRLFRHRVASALGKVELEEKGQAEAALSALSCFAQLPDTDLPRVFAHVGKLGLFEKDAPGLAARLPNLPRPEARSTYTRYLAASDGDSPERGQMLASHRTLVCVLAGR